MLRLTALASGFAFFAATGMERRPCSVPGQPSKSRVAGTATNDRYANRQPPERDDIGSASLRDLLAQARQSTRDRNRQTTGGHHRR